MAKIRRALPLFARPQSYIIRITKKKTNCSVISGPFSGMKYIESAHASAYIPKLLGIYEREIRQFIEMAIASNPKLIIDIGAAEGYYAVGLSLRLPSARVIAFEGKQRARYLLHSLIHMNGVGRRISVEGYCSQSDLQGALCGAPSALLLCDAEGSELELLDPAETAELINAVIIVEVHEFIRVGVKEELRKRFSNTHRIREAWQRPRYPSDFPFRTLVIRFMPSRYLDWAVGESRPEIMSWLFMEPIERE